MTHRYSLAHVLAAALCVGMFFAGAGDAGPTTDKANMAEVVESAMQPLETDPDHKYVASAANGNPVEAFDSLDLAAGLQSRRYSQEIVIDNLSATAAVCWCPTTWATACSATSCTCRGGANPKSIVPAGKSKKIRLAGLLRPCIIAQAAGAEWETERTTNLVGAR